MRPPLLPLALLVAVAACGGDDDDASPDAGSGGVDAAPADAAAPREVVRETVPLVAGEIVEGIFTGGPDDRAVIRLTSDVATLDWNIHGHAGGETQTVYEELDRLTVDYEFVPPAETDWWLLLRNGGDDPIEVALEIELHGELAWEWQ